MMRALVPVPRAVGDGVVLDALEALRDKRGLCATIRASATGEEPFPVWRLVQLANPKDVQRFVEEVASATGAAPQPIESAVRDLANRVEATLRGPAGTESTVREQGHPYLALPEGMARQTGENGHSLLINAQLRITAEVVEDDGLHEARLRYEITGWLGNNPPRTKVIPADQFGGMSWVAQLLGSGAIITAGQSARDHLRAAIQCLSDRPVPQRVVFRHAGWRRHDDAPIYCFHGGAIGACGLVPDVTPQLCENLHLLQLPAPPTGDLLRDAAAVSLDMLSLAPWSVSVPLLATTYLPPLREFLPETPPDFVVWLLGRSGSFKSEMSALAMAHYGEGFTRNTLPAGFEATPNALERIQFDAKDSLIVVDDYHPAADRVEQMKREQLASRLLRGAGNSQGRQRMGRDLNARPDFPPRALALASGEMLPKGYSANARLFPVSIGRDAINVGVLSDLQDQRGLLNAAMAGYVQHLARHHEALRQTLPARYVDLRRRFAGAGAHRRDPGQLAHLQLAFEQFMRFAVEAGALAPHTAAAWTEESRATLLGLSREHAKQLTEFAVHERFRGALRDGLAARRFHIDAKAGGPPAAEDARVWGWAPVRDDAGSTTYRPGPRSELLGWLSDDSLFLIPTAVTTHVCRPAGIEMDESSFCRELFDHGMLVPQIDGNGRRWRHKVWGLPTTRLFRIPVTALFADDDRDGIPGTGKAPNDANRPSVLENAKAIPGLPGLPGSRHWGALSPDDRARLLQEARDGDPLAQRLLDTVDDQ